MVSVVKVSVVKAMRNFVARASPRQCVPSSCVRWGVHTHVHNSAFMALHLAYRSSRSKTRRVERQPRGRDVALCGAFDENLIDINNGDHADTVAYCAPDAIDQMHKVVLEVKGETQLLNLAAKLSEAGVDHKLWMEQPENFPTCLATRPYRKEEVAQWFKKCNLAKGNVVSGN